MPKRIYPTGQAHPMFGKHHTKETRARMITAKLGNQCHLGCKHSKEARSKISKANKERNAAATMREGITRASIQKMSLSLTGRHASEATRKQLHFSHLGLQTGEKHGMYGKHHTERAKAKISQASLEHWQDPSIRDKQLRAMLKASFVRPTGAEIQLDSIINEVCPDEYRYNGDGEVVIARCVPDFINVNGQKKLIEMFGNYWHSQSVTGKTEENEENDKIANNAQLGYDCLVIWECELEDKAKVVARIQSFNTGVTFIAALVNAKRELEQTKKAEYQLSFLDKI